MKTRTKWARVIGIICVVAVLLGVLFFGAQFAIRQLFPLKYTETVEACADAYGISPSLLYAVLHTESRFRPDAVSEAGAYGLMQLTKVAFDEAQHKRDGSITMETDMLTDPTVNITYGGYYLQRMLERFTDTRTALAAYNAGPNRVQGWLEDPAYSTDGITLAYIPYSETANYVERVLRTQEIYQELYSIE